MKPILIVYGNLPANGMAIFPFIFIKKAAFANDLVLVNHEKVHLKQQLELLILPFYIAYLFHYVINLFIYKNHYQAYFNIFFEREAYVHEKDLNYLKKRKLFAWTSYFRKSELG